MFPLPLLEVSLGEGSSPVANLHSLSNKSESFVVWIWLACCHSHLPLDVDASLETWEMLSVLRNPGFPTHTIPAPQRGDKFPVLGSCVPCFPCHPNVWEAPLLLQLNTVSCKSFAMIYSSCALASLTQYFSYYLIVLAVLQPLVSEFWKQETEVFYYRRLPN